MRVQFTEARRSLNAKNKKTGASEPCTHSDAAFYGMQKSIKTRIDICVADICVAIVAIALAA
jgi:hypothetical protein